MPSGSSTSCSQNLSSPLPISVQRLVSVTSLPMIWQASSKNWKFSGRSPGKNDTRNISLPITSGSSNGEPGSNYFCTSLGNPTLARGGAPMSINSINGIHGLFILVFPPLFHPPDLPSRKIHRENIRCLVKPRLKFPLRNRLTAYELMRFRPLLSDRIGNLKKLHPVVHGIFCLTLFPLLHSFCQNGMNEIPVINKDREIPFLCSFFRDSH